jgi:hypothetical protein
MMENQSPPPTPDRGSHGARFARWVFAIAGVYGLLILPPHYFFEQAIGRAHPPPITHPEFFYGFLGVAIAWQVAFLVIALDPKRYRLMMVPAMIEKLSFAAAAIWLFAAGRLDDGMLVAGLIDLTLGLLFAAAFWRCRPAR